MHFKKTVKLSVMVFANLEHIYKSKNYLIFFFLECLLNHINNWLMKVIIIHIILFQFLRMVFLDHISNRLSTSLVKKEEDAMEEDEEDLFLASKIHLRLKMADSSCHKRNHKLALNILADIHKVRVFLRS